jgi:DNA-binding GntR family transcriptional regulator
MARSFRWPFLHSKFKFVQGFYEEQPCSNPSRFLHAKCRTPMADIIDISREIISIPRTALHDQVAQRLRTLLVEGRIAPGAKLNERELCECCTCRARRCARPSRCWPPKAWSTCCPTAARWPWKLTEADVRTRLRGAGRAGGLSGELAAQRITDAELAEIRALHYEMLAAFDAARPVGLLPAERAHPRRHQCRGAQPGADADLRQVNARVQALRFRTNQDEAKWQRAVQEHEADGRRAGRARRRRLRDVLVQHLQHKRDAVLQLMRRGAALPGNSRPMPPLPCP